MSGQVRSSQARSGQVRSTQVRSGQVRSGQVLSGQVRSGQVSSGQVKRSWKSSSFRPLVIFLYIAVLFEFSVLILDTWQIWHFSVTFWLLLFLWGSASETSGLVSIRFYSRIKFKGMTRVFTSVLEDSIEPRKLYNWRKECPLLVPESFSYLEYALRNWREIIYWYLPLENSTAD